MKTKVALAAAIVLGVVAMLAMRQHIKTIRESAMKGRLKTNVLVANRALEAGTKFLPSYTRPESREAGSLTRTTLTDSDMEHYRGRTLHMNVREGDILQTTHFYRPPRDERLDQAVLVGERAITVSVDQITGVAGMILPGSRVDVMATFAVGSGDSGGMSQTNFITRHILSNVRVLATDRQTVSGGDPVGPDGFGGRGGYSSITLAVSPLEAEILTLAQKQGQGMLTLTLRNPTDNKSSGATVPPVDLHSLDDSIQKADQDRIKKMPRQKKTEDETLDIEKMLNPDAKP